MKILVLIMFTEPLVASEGVGGKRGTKRGLKQGVWAAASVVE